MFVQVVGDAKRENVIMDERSKSFIGINIVPFLFVELYINKLYAHKILKIPCSLLVPVDFLNR